eukprot:s2271_g2.t1
MRQEPGVHIEVQSRSSHWYKIPFGLEVINSYQATLLCAFSHHYRSASQDASGIVFAALKQQSSGYSLPAANEWPVLDIP